MMAEYRIAGWLGAGAWGGVPRHRYQVAARGSPQAAGLGVRAERYVDVPFSARSNAFWHRSITRT
jgi:hypothetical protein